MRIDGGPRPSFAASRRGLLLLQPRHPHVAAQFKLIRDEQSVDNSRCKSCRAPTELRIVKVVDGKDVAHWPATRGINRDRIQAPEAVSLDQEVQQSPIRRPARCPASLLCNGNPIALGRRRTGTERRDDNAPPAVKRHPPFVRCETHVPRYDDGHLLAGIQIKE